MADRVTVLVIDDDPSIRDYLETLATRQGYGVHTATDGESALAGLDRTRPDLITLDTVLPGMDGLETLRRIKQRIPEVPVIMLSGHGQARTIVEAMRLGATDFLRKPFEVEELELAFRKALENRALSRGSRSICGDAFEARSMLLLLGGDNPQMREVREIIEQVADTDITVLVRGESGTGKEVVARALFQLGNRRNRPFVKVNCAALPSELLESELFGFEKGAFTGAQKRKLGKFEYANQGTIFLDEISEMASGPAGEAPAGAAGRRVLAARRRGRRARRRAHHRGHQPQPRGGGRRKASFREDLYYRLNVVTIQIPPLRERIDAVPLLVEHFLVMYNEQYNKCVEKLSTDTMRVLMHYHWPGNVRELENMVKRMVVLGNEQAVLQEIGQRGLPASPRASDDDVDLAALGADIAAGRDLDLKAIAKRAAQIAEKKVIERVLAQTRWNRKEAAERLQISYKALLYKMKENGLSDGR